MSYSFLFCFVFVSQNFSSSNVFQWVDGTELTFTNWVTRAPDNLDEKCGEMTSYSSFYGRWNDNSCRKHQAFICQTG